MTGPELKAIRRTISEAVGDRLSHLDMAALCGLSDPGGNGADTYRKWENGDGPSGPVATLLLFLASGLIHSDHGVREFCLAYVRGSVGITE